MNHTHQTSEQLSNWAVEFERLGLIEIIKEFKEENTLKYISYLRLCLITW